MSRMIEKWAEEHLSLRNLSITVDTSIPVTLPPDPGKEDQGYLYTKEYSHTLRGSTFPGYQHSKWLGRLSMVVLRGDDAQEAGADIRIGRPMVNPIWEAAAKMAYDQGSVTVILESLTVDPECRGRGLSRLLIKRALGHHDPLNRLSHALLPVTLRSFTDNVEGDYSTSTHIDVPEHFAMFKSWGFEPVPETDKYLVATPETLEKALVEV